MAGLVYVIIAIVIRFCGISRIVKLMPPVIIGPTVSCFTSLLGNNAQREINGAYLLSLFAAYVPVAFVVFAEHLADHENLSSIIGENLLENPGLTRTLPGDGVGGMTVSFGAVEIRTTACSLILGILTNVLLSGKEEGVNDEAPLQK